MKLEKRNKAGLFLAMIYCYSLVVLFSLNTQDHSSTEYKDTKLLQLATFSYEDYTSVENVFSNQNLNQNKSNKLRSVPFVHSTEFELLTNTKVNQYVQISNFLEIEYTNTDIIYPFHNFL